ncbi:MAG: hypothetical protein C4297_00035 [Gemmataceae bacterium]
MLSLAGSLPINDLQSGSWWVLALIPILIAVNMFFVATEFALVAVRRSQVEEMVQKGLRGARLLDKATRQLDRYIAAIQLGITGNNIALGWIAEPALTSFIVPVLVVVGMPATAASRTLGFVLAYLLVTGVLVVIGELVPKTIVLQQPQAFALRLIWPLELFTRATRPLVLALNGLARVVLRLLGYRQLSPTHMAHSVEELMIIVEEVEEAGLLSEEQAEYVQNVFRLAKKTVRECMVPKEKMAAIELHTPPEQVLEIVRQGAHTRMPVYDGTLDNIVGIVNTKDLFYLFSVRGVVVIEDALYPPLFLKPEQPIADGLRLFRRAHRPMALVRDDEGHILGLITLEDILEEIVGDIEDEHDRPLRRVRWRAPRAALIVPGAQPTVKAKETRPQDAAPRPPSGDTMGSSASQQ